MSDRPVLTLVVLGPDQTADVPGVRGLVESIVRECGNAGRTFKAALLFALADSSAAMVEQARELLAWEDIEDDHETVARLDEGQRRQLRQKLERAKTDLRESVWRSYRRVLLLGRDNVVRESDLGSVTSSSAESMVDLILRHFLQSDDITKAVGANQLVRYWPAALTEWSTKAVRDAFYASPLLPRLLKGDVIRRTVSDGVSQKVFGYARRNSDGQLKLERFGESLAEMEVELSEDVFLLKAADAQKLLEPPRVAALAIRPAAIQVKPGETVAFTAEAADQYGQPFPVADVEWTASGGSVDRAGRFVAGTDGGYFTVHAVAGARRGVRRRARRCCGLQSGPAPGSAGRPPLVRRCAAPEVDELLHQGRQPFRLRARPEAHRGLRGARGSRPDEVEDRRDEDGVAGVGVVG